MIESNLKLMRREARVAGRDELQPIAYRRPRPRPEPLVRVLGFALIDWHLGICDGDRSDRGAHEAALGVPERGDGVDASAGVPRPRKTGGGHSTAP